MNTNMTGFGGFSKIFFLDAIQRVNMLFLFFHNGELLFLFQYNEEVRISLDRVDIEGDIISFINDRKTGTERPGKYRPF